MNGFNKEPQYSAHLGGVVRDRSKPIWILAAENNEKRKVTTHRTISEKDYRRLPLV